MGETELGGSIPLMGYALVSDLFKLVTREGPFP